MPELPEVEFARASLARWLQRATIEAVEVPDPRILEEGTEPGDIVRALVGRRVVTVARRGKWLRIALDRGLLFSHLGMTGKWTRPARSEASARAVVVLHVKRSAAMPARAVTYVDARLFGRFVTAETDLPAWVELGPDPLLDGIDPDALHAALSRRRGSVKAALLDQTLLAGIGNIQAIEGLYFAGVDPRRPGATLTRTETQRIAAGLLQSIHATLASQTRGLTYMSEGGDNPFTLYGREAKPCPRCSGPLTKLTLAGRGTVLCERCQR